MDLRMSEEARMDEHEDDVEPEVEDGVEFEVEEFPVLIDDEGGVGGDDLPDIDPDPSEI